MSKVLLKSVNKSKEWFSLETLFKIIFVSFFLLYSLYLLYIRWHYLSVQTKNLSMNSTFDFNTEHYKEFSITNQNLTLFIANTNNFEIWSAQTSDLVGQPSCQSNSTEEEKKLPLIWKPPSPEKTKKENRNWEYL